MGQAAQGLCAIEADLPFLTGGSPLLGSVPNSSVPGIGPAE